MSHNNFIVVRLNPIFALYLKARSHIRRKRKQRSHIEHKRM